MQKAYNICNVTLRKIYVVSIFYIYIKQMNWKLFDKFVSKIIFEDCCIFSSSCSDY